MLKLRNKNCIPPPSYTTNVFCSSSCEINTLYELGRYLSRSHFLLDDERFPGDTTVNVLNIICRSLKMTCSIVTLGDVTTIFSSIFNGNKEIRYGYKSELIMHDKMSTFR